jgi:small-conductance mechanosensitive channel
MKAILLVGLFIGYLLGVSMATKTVERLGHSKAVQAYRVKYISKVLQLVFTLLFLMVASLILGVEHSQVSVFLSSVFAVIGIALFAQWSILSNVTASLIIFFAFPYRVGDNIKILDGDEDISGVIEDISLFHVMIRKDRDLVTYPNSLILQKAVIRITDT